MSNLFLDERQFEDVFNSHIKIETYTKSIDSIFFGKRKLERIDYKPYYQRNYVWDDSKATYFIESILLGTEIPPLIFFNEGRTIEVIDGRQRFETIKRFIESDFSLSKNGLTALLELAKSNIDALRSEHASIYESFLDAKIRIIEFELVNKPPSDPVLIDKIKKEIFTRYNSGITALKRAEIDNAIYDSDSVSRYFKEKLKSTPAHKDVVSSTFLREYKSSDSQNIESIMQFIRKSLVLYRFPIRYYAGGKARVELVTKFYEYIYEDCESPKDIYEEFIAKVEIIKEIKRQFSESGINPNRLFWECILWSENILEQEGIDYKGLKHDGVVSGLRNLFESNENVFDSTDSHYYKETMQRFSTIGEFLEAEYGICLSLYLQGSDSSKDEIAKVRAYDDDARTEIEKLESLRITKPDPSRVTIEDVHRAMNRTRFLVRPSYQRSEVINLAKASAIIESILLGIMLPAIFVYKRKDGVSEVIDGQQRLLTILAFMGEKYLDENNNYCFSKNNEFRLKNLRILKQYNGKSFCELPEDIQEKILEFDLFVVEIEERLNEEFNPVDLFIRLNDKPFPIRENSFEMWNSWADKEVVDTVRKLLGEVKEWFYIQNVNKDKFRDRMSNEELITILSYFDFRKRQGKDVSSFLDIYQKGGRINARIKQKKDVTALLVDVSESSDQKVGFLRSVLNVKNFIDNTRELLGVGDDVEALKNELDALMSSGSKSKYYKRTMQDIYILWEISNGLSFSREERSDVYSKVKDIFNYMKNIPENLAGSDEGYQNFLRLMSSLKLSYSVS